MESEPPQGEGAEELKLETRDGRWEMGDGRWEMGDGRREMGEQRRERESRKGEASEMLMDCMG